MNALYHRRDILKGTVAVAGASLAGFPFIECMSAQPPAYDAAVIGGGISGLSAALEACLRGKRVLVVQVQPLLGGNAYLSTGWFYACNSPLQRKHSETADTPEQFTKDSLAVASGRRDPMWTSVVAENSGRDIAWLEQNGVVFEDFVTSSMGSTVPRAIQVKGYGRALINALENAIVKTGCADFLFETRCTGLLVENGNAHL